MRPNNLLKPNRERLILDTTKDLVTGREIALCGAEENRQAVEKLLLEEKGFQRDDIEVDVPIKVVVGSKIYESKVDLVVGIDGRRLMVIKCVAGSIGSYERETVAAARLLQADQIPLSVVCDGQNAVVLDTLTGKRIGTDVKEIATRQQVLTLSARAQTQPLAKERTEKEALIFRSYDSMKVNT